MFRISTRNLLKVLNSGIVLEVLKLFKRCVEKGAELFVRNVFTSAEDFFIQHIQRLKFYGQHIQRISYIFSAHSTNSAFLGNFLAQSAYTHSHLDLVGDFNLDCDN